MQRNRHVADLEDSEGREAAKEDWADSGVVETEEAVANWEWEVEREAGSSISVP